MRELVVRLELGVTDGWLLGGPGATVRDVEVRWIEALVHVPLAVDGTTPGSGFTEIVLHDAHVFAVDRPRGLSVPMVLRRSVLPRSMGL